MKFSAKGTGKKHRVYINDNDVSIGVTSANIDIEAMEIANITLNISTVYHEIIEENANLFIVMGDKKYRIIEEL